ncbi:MAG: acyltransferase [Polyangiaceae bacterium]|jgi:peptidoglycan/LPS O-acetylase OafA/YrhL
MRRLAARVLSRFRRVTSGGAFIPEIDGLRFFAIVPVVLFHLNGNLLVRLGGGPWEEARTGVFGTVLSRGDLGVRLFFVLSGLVLGLPFARHARGIGPRVSLKAYYLRRLTRIEPPNVVVLTLFFALLVGLGRYSVSSLFPHLVASVFNVHNLVYGKSSLVNFVTWSLEVEVQFYLVAPLLARVYRHPNSNACRLLLVALVAAGSVGDVCVQLADPRVALSLAGLSQFFLAGMLVADLRAEDESRRARGSSLSSPTAGCRQGMPGAPWLGDALGVAAAIAIIAIGKDSTWARLFLPMLLAGFVVCALRGSALRSLVRLPVVTTIGGMCYSIYLVHMQIISPVTRLTGRLVVGPGYPVNFIVQACLTLPVVLAGSAALYLFVERPFMLWRPFGAKTAPGAGPRV